VLQFPEAAIGPILDDVRDYGAKRKETGGFLLSPLDDPARIGCVAFAGALGITRRYGLFGISGAALDRLFTWADDHSLRIPAQFHSHGGRAFLSPTDLAHGLSVRGFVTCVIPFFREPPDDPARWGWWRFDGRKWLIETPPALYEDGAIPSVIFDERGVR
jgi:hypothetical protein